MQALPGANAEHSPHNIGEREAFSMPYWLARNDPGRLSRRGIRHIALAGAAFATLRLTINGIRATTPNDAFAQTLANEVHRMGQRRPFFLPFLPFRPNCAVAKLPPLRHPRLFRRIISIVARHVHA